MWETWVRSLGWEDPMEKEMTTHSSILAWWIPWTEEPVGVAKSRTRLIDFTSLCLSEPKAWAETFSPFSILERFFSIKFQEFKSNLALGKVARGRSFPIWGKSDLGKSEALQLGMLRFSASDKEAHHYWLPLALKASPQRGWVGCPDIGVPETSSWAMWETRQPLPGLMQALGRREASSSLQANPGTQWGSGQTAILGATGAKFLAKWASVSMRWWSPGAQECNCHRPWCWAKEDPRELAQWVEGMAWTLGSRGPSPSLGSVLCHPPPGTCYDRGMSHAIPGWRWAFITCSTCEILELRLGS